MSGDRPKDAVRAVKKRLNGNKNYREVMLTLTVSRFYTYIYIYSNILYTDQMSLLLHSFNKKLVLFFCFRFLRLV